MLYAMVSVASGAAALMVCRSSSRAARGPSGSSARYSSTVDGIVLLPDGLAGGASGSSHPIDTAGVDRGFVAGASFRVEVMVYVVAAIAGLAFGMADQYLGSLSSRIGGWAAAVSQLAAPWMVLPFLAGMTQNRARRAMAGGGGGTGARVLGYF